MEWFGVSFEQAWISSTLPDSICQMKRALFVGQFVRWAFDSNACSHISEVAGPLSFNPITFIGCIIIWVYAPKQAWDARSSWPQSTRFSQSIQSRAKGLTNPIMFISKRRDQFSYSEITKINLWNNGEVPCVTEVSRLTGHSLSDQSAVCVEAWQMCGSCSVHPTGLFFHLLKGSAVENLTFQRL